MSTPTEGDDKLLKRIARYLRGRPRVVIKYPFQHSVDKLEVITDSDWAGCPRSCRSISSELILAGKPLLKS